ncbi:MAG: hypothetical protein M1812_002234 [Candelaria pacifica]|nr:MAG: hypothetical protein M1812_002234 [Candelaria pacifica]
MAMNYVNSAILQIGSPDGFGVIQAFVQWHLNSQSTPSNKSYFQTVDIILRGIPVTALELSPKAGQVRLKRGNRYDEIPNTKCSAFLISVVHDLVKRSSKETALKLVLPVEDGYIVRSDFLEQRLYGCPNVLRKEQFVAPRGHLSKPRLSSSNLQDFSNVLASAAGGIMVDNASERSQISLLSELEGELHGRLSLPWLIPQPIPERTIAILGHRSYFMMQRWFTAGTTMGIKVLVFGQYGSWLENPERSYLVEQFIPIDMSIDQGLPTRIVDALQACGRTIDGITTTIDVYFDAAARVSEILNIPTSPIESIAISQDKYLTQTLFGNNTQSLLVSDLNDLRQQIEAGTESLTYPLIVKPSKGWSSEGVFKVTCREELFAAVRKVSSFAAGIKIIVESYVDGPEIDANFLMWEGEILFFEVVDGFPCSADVEKSAESANFQELEMVYPSNLIESERELLRTEVHQFLLSIGFKTGIFHVEARLRNSAMAYNKVDGVTDLRLKAQKPVEKPKIFILEVNIRCPGWMVIWATAYAYGVDYAAFQMLAALGDGDRAKVLAQPFSFGPQATVESVFVPTPRGGRLGPEATCEELAIRRPDLMRDVIRIQTMAQPGETVPDPSSGILSFVAAFNLATNSKGVGRTEMLRVGQAIREELQIDIS